MYLGKVVETAPARVLSSRAAHPYSRLLWSAVDPEGGRRLPATGSVQRWELSEQERPRTGCRFRDRCPVYHAEGQPAICRDRGTEPTLAEVGPGHFVACHFPEGLRGGGRVH
jgi:oligopeptide/dipeptide ABC transporter ATP-binding protein